MFDKFTIYTLSVTSMEYVNVWSIYVILWVGKLFILYNIVQSLVFKRITTSTELKSPFLIIISKEVLSPPRWSDSIQLMKCNHTLSYNLLCLTTIMKWNIQQSVLYLYFYLSVSLILSIYLSYIHTYIHTCIHAYTHTCIHT